MSDLPSVQAAIQASIISPFDAIRQTTPEGQEWWSARDLMPLLGYDNWQNFSRCIGEAMRAAEIVAAQDQFIESSKMIQAGKGAQRSVLDVRLTRYACYMVAMSCDGSKPEVAAAKTYFAIKTREAETAVAVELSDDEIVHRALAISAQRVTALTERVAELKPKAELAETFLIAQGGARLVREVAPSFGMREIDLRRFLIEEKLIYVRHAQCGAVQYNHYADFAHHFKPYEHLVNHRWGTCMHYTLYVLPRGRELITERLRQAGRMLPPS